MHPITTATQVCAVIGNPVAHSLSPAIHNAAFAATGLDYVYVAFRVEDVGSCLAGMRAMAGFRGMSVTIPHKQAVMRHLDEIEPMARHIGSVNTITNDEGRLVGSTTDGPGTLRAFADAGVALRRRRVLFLGSGGAVRAVAFAFGEMAGVDRVTILGRTRENVEALAGDLRASVPTEVGCGSLTDDLYAALAEHDVIVQGTPVGMDPDTETSCVPARSLRPDQVVFDMVYRPLKTRLLRDAEAAGCVVIPGVEMLVHQAVLQFEAWTGIPAPYGAMRAALLAALAPTP